MDCREAGGLMNQFIDDRLEGEKLEGFIKHVRQCPSCYDELEVNYTVMSVIRLLEDENKTSDLLKQLDHKLEEKEYQIYQRQKSLRLRWGLGGIVFMTVLFAALILRVMFFHHDSGKKTLTVARNGYNINVLSLKDISRPVDHFLYMKTGDRIQLILPEKFGQEGRWDLCIKKLY